ncbi:MAG: solute-binding protein [Deltaproteobacteria bacterium]|nr:solute-binding protein [Deltaproteobacteria bacterium]
MRLLQWFLVLSFLFPPGVSAAVRIRCASTTSTQNSGLLDYLLPLFERESGIHVDVVAVGTGAALEIGKRGDADVVLVHAKDLELKALKAGFFVKRRDVMYNDFVILGPPADPAGIRGAATVPKAFRLIAAKGAPFVSRGDRSGTHHRELFLWKKAGISPKGRPWYMEVGQGMAKTLRIASEKQAYTLSDRGTWLAVSDRDRLALSILYEGSPLLRNQYGVMAVNPAKHPHVKYPEAMKLIRWLTSPAGQKAIAAFKGPGGQQLFFPDAR